MPRGAVSLSHGNRVLDLSSGPIVMGILNVTPDSFYDGGRFASLERARSQAERMIEEGAAIIDVGGASSRPGSDPVPPDTECGRVLPVIETLRASWNGWISVDTYRAEVARAAIEAGADMINDISAGSMDVRMKEVAADTGVPAVLMHMKGTPKNMQQDPRYKALLPEMIEYFETRIRDWTEAGVAERQILLDPGIGFGKTLTHNLLILKHLDRIAALDRPVVLGTSRKSFIGTVLGREVEDRLVGTLATVALGAWHGALIHRVHDVGAARDALAMVHAVRSAREEGEE